MSQSADSGKSTHQKISDAVHGRDELLDKKAPGSPFIVVALSFLGVLVVVLFIATLIMLSLR